MAREECCWAFDDGREAHGSRLTWEEALTLARRAVGAPDGARPIVLERGAYYVTYGLRGPGEALAEIWAEG